MEKVIEKIHPLLDKDKQEKAKIYEREKRIFGFLGTIVTAIFQLFFYFSGLSRTISEWNIFSNIIWTFIIFMLLYSILQTIVKFPVSYISNFTIEHKYGFSKQSKGEWLWDHLKSFLISLIFGIILYGALLIIFNRFPDIWWLIAGGFIALFSVILSTLFPVLIMPIFHHYEKIEDEELKSSLSGVLNEADINIEGFYREDTSKKTTKENAMLAGMGATKRVILTDNIIENMKMDEIKTVLAHEVGHYRKKHLIKFIIIGTILQIIAFFLLNEIMYALFPMFLSGFRENLALLPMLLFYLLLIDLIVLNILQNWIARHYENEADVEALKLSKDPEAFQRAMAGLANRNLSNAYPSLWIKLMYYSHPPVGERLELAEEFKEEDSRGQGFKKL
jgi:STE24 endopeptidase